jgi:hypothetical protein
MWSKNCHDQCPCTTNLITPHNPCCPHHLWIYFQSKYHIVAQAQHFALAFFKKIEIITFIWYGVHNIVMQLRWSEDRLSFPVTLSCNSCFTFSGLFSLLHSDVGAVIWVIPWLVARTVSFFWSWSYCSLTKLKGCCIKLVLAWYDLKCAIILPTLLCYTVLVPLVV